MKLNRFTRLLLVSVVLIALLPATTGAVPASGSPERIDRFILDQLATQPRVNLFVKMDSDAVLDRAESLATKTARGQFVYDTLTAYAASSQKSIKSFLDGSGVRYSTFWINNSLYVYDADMALVEALAGRSDVAYLRGNRSVPLHRPISVNTNAAAPQAIEWGVSLIQAPDVWAMGNRGAGIVVASIDSGVRWTHDSIDQAYRGSDGNHDYDWWDPQMALPAPVDTFNHGTHTMGTMVGDDGGANQIGIATEAQWITADGCPFGSCPDFDLLSSAQFITCPTKLDGTDPDCSLAPHVVNNSWGGFGANNFYQGAVSAWRAAGIVPVFSAGNSGPSCGTVGYPGNYKKVIGVGATNINDTLASFSSRGPSPSGMGTRRLKPDLVAPGENVRSASNSSDTAYIAFSGTSMAAPHTVGTVALMLNDTPGASFLDIVTALTSTADTAPLDNPTNPDSCSGRAWDAFPSFHYGYGRINALDAVNALP